MLRHYQVKFVNEEALGYGKWAFRSITEDKYLDLDQIPPISVAAKRFLQPIQRLSQLN